MNRVFFAPDLKRYVLFPLQVLETLYAHAQSGPNQNEAGGEIFAADPNASGLVLAAAMGPNREDRRSRWAFNPDIGITTRNRGEAFKKGLHAVGLWHTHPEQCPYPSELDRSTTRKYLEAFNGDRQRYLMVIIGNSCDVPDLVVYSAEAESDRYGWVKWHETAERL